MQSIHVSPYAVPQQSQRYQDASAWLKAQMVADLKPNDPLAWRVMCYIDGRRSVRGILALLPPGMPAQERLAAVEKALYRLIERYGLVAREMQEEQRASVSPWPSARLPSRQRPALAAPQKRPAMRQKKKVSRSRPGVRTSQAWAFARRCVGVVWAWRRPVGAWLVCRWRDLGLLVHGRRVEPRRSYRGQYQVPQRPLTPYRGFVAPHKPIHLQPDNSPVPVIEREPARFSQKLRAVLAKRKPAEPAA